MELLARRKRLLLVVGALTGLGMLASCLSAAEPPGPPAAAAEPARVQEAEGPHLDLKTLGPAKVAVDGKVTFEILVTNVGKTTAANLLVIDRFDPGLEHPAAASPIEHDLDDLAPGKSQRLKLTFRVTRPGLLAHSVEITSGGRSVVSGRATVRAVAADELDKPLPGSAFPEIPFREPAQDEDRDKPPDLGPPLVDNPDGLKRLHPQYPVWVDRKNRRAVVMGGVCLRQAALELFACLRGSKEHESVLTVPAKASFVHAALLAVGAEPGAPAVFQPKYVPAHGTEIEITLAWKDAKGQRQTARAQDWVRDARTKKAMEHRWVFAGSRFITNATTGQVVYQADREGDFICVSNFPAAVLDLPILSTSTNEELLFEAFTERIPAVGTPVTMILTPKPPKPETKPEPAAKPPRPSKPEPPKAAALQPKPEVKPEPKAPAKPQSKPEAKPPAKPAAAVSVHW